MLIHYFIIVLLVQAALAQDAATIRKALETEKLIPDVVNATAASLHLLNIKYDSGVSVQLGNELTPTQVAHVPNVTWTVEPKQKYVLVMVDPDAPSRAHPFYREILHWLVINISGDDVAHGQTIVPYAGSGPSEGSGLHRYALFLFKQPTLGDNATFALMTGEGEDLAQNRQKFYLEHFAFFHSLGQPIAANYFHAQFDESIRARSDQRLVDAVRADQVVPDVIDSPPTHISAIKYANDRLVLIGSELTPTQVKEKPIYFTWPAEANALYTVAMVDPDATSRANPVMREILHWLVVNVPATRDITKGDTVAEYMGSGPPQDSGLHRYVFLVYKQSAHLTLNATAIARVRFHVRDFAKEHALGQPVAGNYFQAQFETHPVS